MALSDADATVIVGVIAAAAAVIGPQQWHVRHKASKKLAEDVTTVLTAKDQTIEVQASEIVFLREQLAEERGKVADGPAK